MALFDAPISDAQIAMLRCIARTAGYSLLRVSSSVSGSRLGPTVEMRVYPPYDLWGTPTTGILAHGFRGAVRALYIELYRPKEGTNP